MLEQNSPSEYTISRVSESGTSIAVFSEIGASCSNLSLLGRDLITTGIYTDPTKMYFGTLLAPWPNRLAGGAYKFQDLSFQFQGLDADGNKNHGLVGDKAIEVATLTSDSITFKTGFDSDQYPFDIELLTTYSIGETFEVKAEVTNYGASSAPFALGFHPYFRIPGASRLHANVLEHFSTDAKMIPVSSKSIAELDISFPNDAPLDDCFSAPDWKLQLETSDYVLEITQQNLPYLMLYKPANSPFASGDPGLAIEPMSAPANAFNSEIEKHLLEPGETKAYSFGIRILS